MRNFKIAIKNYRCFEDTKPLSIELGRDFTALVGSNNSGKTALLKFFYEFKNLWVGLGNIAQIEHAINNGVINIEYVDVFDQSEIFPDTNNREMSIDIDFEGKTEKENIHPLKRISFTCSRTSPSSWRIKYFIDKGQQLNNFKKRHSSTHLICQIGDDSAVDVLVNFQEMLDLMRILQNVLYIGAFRNAITEGTAKYFSLQIGTSFIATWKSWKTGNNRQKNITVLNITEDIRRIFNWEKLEINASDDSKTLQVYINGKPRKLPELGSGLAQFIIVLGNAGIVRPSIILIDEPELNLHPTLQVDFITSLASYAEQGVMFATHSIGLARATADRIYSFQMDNGRSIVKPLEGTPNYLQFMGELSYSSYATLGYSRILLVEGVKDVRIVQQFLRELKKDHETVILPLGGDQLATGCTEQELTEFKRLSENISAIVDSEQTSPDGAPSPKREDFKKVCEKLKINVHLTERRAIENYFTEKAIQSIYSEKYKALEPYELLKESSNPWSKSEGRRIANKMSFNDIRDTDLGKFLESI